MFKIDQDTICKLLGIAWIVSTGAEEPGNRGAGELGLKIGPVQFWYYKWTEPMILYRRPHRIAGKREFGETVKSIKS